MPKTRQAPHRVRCYGYQHPFLHSLEIHKLARFPPVSTLDSKVPGCIVSMWLHPPQGICNFKHPLLPATAEVCCNQRQIYRSMSWKLVVFKFLIFKYILYKLVQMKNRLGWKKMRAATLHLYSQYYLLIFSFWINVALTWLLSLSIRKG